MEGANRARAVTGAAALTIVGWTLTTGASYSIVSHFVHIRPVTTVDTTRPEVGVLVDAPASQIPAIADYLSARGIRASFTISPASYPQEPLVMAYGDQALPRLPHGGLVRWLRTRDQLRDLSTSHHFLYASSGPSVGQWWIAHGAGGRLVAGAIRLQDADDSVGHMRAGEVIELECTKPAQVATLRRQARPWSRGLSPARSAGRPADSRRRLDRIAFGLRLRNSLDRPRDRRSADGPPVLPECDGRVTGVYLWSLSYLRKRPLSVHYQCTPRVARTNTRSSGVG